MRGADFETLYPEVFEKNYFTKCKLQMMRLAVQPDNWRIGPALCSGLSLAHYKDLKCLASLPALKQHFEATLPDYIRWEYMVWYHQNGKEN